MLNEKDDNRKNSKSHKGNRIIKDYQIDTKMNG